MKTVRPKLIQLPKKQLRASSKKVGVITDEIKKIIQAMEQATLDWEDSREHEVGVALAAIQIDIPLRVIIVRNDFDNKKDRTFQVFINPEITKLDGKIIEDFEGCLSIKDIYGKVPRYERVKLKALDIDGKPIRVKAEGFLARVFQHEIDHTNGIVFIDHIKEVPTAFYHLTSQGQLEELNYEKDVQDSRILW